MTPTFQMTPAQFALVDPDAPATRNQIHLLDVRMDDLEESEMDDCNRLSQAIIATAARVDALEAENAELRRTLADLAAQVAEFRAR